MSGEPDRDDRKPALPHSLRIGLFVAPDQPEHPYGQQADEAARAQRVNNVCDVRNDAHALRHERHGTQAEKLSHNGQGKQADAKLSQTTNPVPNGTDMSIMISYTLHDRRIMHRRTARSRKALNFGRIISLWA